MVNPDLRRIAQDKTRYIIKNNHTKADELERQAQEIIKNNESLQVEYKRYIKMCTRMLVK